MGSKQKLTLVILIFFCASQLPAQKTASPYQWNWKIDGTWTAAGLGGTALGLVIGRKKTNYSEAEVNALRKEDVFVLDRWATGYYSENANKLSDYPFYSSFVVPFALLFDGNANDHPAQLFGLYVESLATTSALFNITAGLIDRPRPLVFSEDAPIGQRTRKNSKRSFYSGHVAATATALFFAAKVYSDFNPDSRLKAYFWAGAFTITAATSYLRLKAGKHFLTDILLGYALGAATGYLVPELHKIGNKNISFTPIMGRTMIGNQYQGLALSYRFL